MTMKATISKDIAREIAGAVEPIARNIQKILNERPSDVSRDVWLLATGHVLGIFANEATAEAVREKQTPGTEAPGADGSAADATEPPQEVD